MFLAFGPESVWSGETPTWAHAYQVEGANHTFDILLRSPIRLPSQKIIAVGAANERSDFLLLEFEADGTIASTLSTPLGIGRATDLALLPNGDMVVAGLLDTEEYLEGNADFVTNESYLARFTPDGELVWDRHFFYPNVDTSGDIPTSSQSLSNVTVTPEGRIVILGTGAFFDFDITLTLVAFNPDGSLAWARKLGKSGVNARGRSSSSLTSDPDGNIYVGAEFNGSERGSLIVKVNPSGGIEWQRVVTGFQSDAHFVSADGGTLSSYVGGADFSGTHSNSLLEFTASGSFLNAVPLSGRAEKARGAARLAGGELLALTAADGLTPGAVTIGDNDEVNSARTYESSADHVAPTDDGGALISFMQASFDSIGNLASVLLKTDTSGAVNEFCNFEGTASVETLSDLDQPAFLLPNLEARSLEVEFLGTEVSFEKNATEINRTQLCTPPPEPDIATVPSSVDYGLVNVGETITESLVIRNDGDANLSIDEVAPPSLSEYSISTDDCSGFTLTPGAECNVDIQYDPQSVGTHEDHITVRSNDPDETELQVNLTGSADHLPDIAISPATVDFGILGPGDEVTRTLEVANDGVADLSITKVAEPSSSEFSIVSDACSDVTVAPESNCEIRVKYAPNTLGNHSDALAIESDDPDESQVTAELSGTAKDLIFADSFKSGKN